MNWRTPFTQDRATAEQIAQLRGEIRSFRDALSDFRAYLVVHIGNLEQRIITMSQSLSQQLDAATQAIRDDVAAVSAEVSRLLAGMNPGSQITQAQVDALTAIDTSLKAIPSDTPTAPPVP